MRLATESWRERRITFENAPRVSPRFVSSGRLRARAWKAVDITSLVGENDDEVNLALTTVAPGRDRLCQPGKWDDRALSSSGTTAAAAKARIRPQSRRRSLLLRSIPLKG